MSTLLLRFAAPMQSWGGNANFDTRTTEREPTKSGVVGLLAAALGRRRDEDISDLRQLRLGIRVDREGSLLRDYHTVSKSTTDETWVTERYYLCDAVFLIGLESDDDAFLQSLADAVRQPVYPLFFGRRSCPVTEPVVLKIENSSLEDSLKNEPLLVEIPEEEINEDNKYVVRTVCDAQDGDNSLLVNDLPISFNPIRREMGYRFVKEDFIEFPVPIEAN